MVLGGKSHEFVVQLPGVVSGQLGVPDHGVLVDAGQAAGFADADAFGKVPQDVEDLVRRQPRVEEGRALALGEARLAGAAIEQAALLGPVTGTDGEVAVAALPVVGAVGILAAEQREVVHRMQPRQVTRLVSQLQPL